MFFRMFANESLVSLFVQDMFISHVGVLGPLLNMGALSRAICTLVTQHYGTHCRPARFPFCQPGWLERSVAYRLVGWYSWLVTSKDQHSAHVQPLPFCFLQHKGLISDARQQARAFRHLKHTAATDELSLHQTQRLSVPVFACPLCHETDSVVWLGQWSYASVKVKIIPWLTCYWIKIFGIVE